MSASLLLAYISAALVLQVGAAMAVALWRHRSGGNSKESAPRFDRPKLGAWDGWREFRVVRREFEDSAHSVCSFYLAPVDGTQLPSFVPGQFLTFAVPIGVDRTLTRCYSLSDGPNPSSYRISVKRVQAPAQRPELPPGTCSNYLHDRVQIGDLVKAKAPAGSFVVDSEPNVPIVLIAGGIGITPLLSMLRGGLAAEPNRRVDLYYGVRHGAEHVFRKELEELARVNPNFHLNVVYSCPSPDDTPNQAFQHVGHINVDLLRRNLPAGRHSFYLCGPPAMMTSLIPALSEWGVLLKDIHHEEFGPASSRLVQISSDAKVPRAAPLFNVMFRKSARTLVWDGKDANLLAFAERHDVWVESGCRTGSCGACEVKIISGTVLYAKKPDHEITPGHCLLCVGSPDSKLEVEA